jgi:ribonuclease P protein component
LKKHGLSAFEKIKSRKEFERVFTGGKTTYSSDNKVRANYRITTGSNKFMVTFAVAVGKKLGNAVWRNRVKRLVREVYRYNKLELVEICKIKNACLEVIFSPQNLNQQKNKHVWLKDIESPLKEIIAKIREEI